MFCHIYKLLAGTACVTFHHRWGPSRLFRESVQSRPRRAEAGLRPESEVARRERGEPPAAVSERIWWHWHMAETDHLDWWPLGQVASRDHGGVHIRQPRHTGRGRGWVQEENLVIDTFKMLRGKSDLSKTRSRKSCYGIQKQSVRLKKFTAGIYLIEHLTFFSWVDDGVHNLLRGHIPGHRRGSHHPVRHLLQTAPEEEAQLWHQEG